MVDDRVGSIDDGSCRAVVLLQLVYLRGWVISLEGENILNLGSTEGVDTLRIVTHYTYVRVFECQTAYDGVLGEVGILILIDKQILESLLIIGKHIWKISEQNVCLQQQVIEVHCSVLLASLAILYVYCSHLGNLALAILRGECRIGNICARCDKAVLGRRDT